MAEGCSSDEVEDGWLESVLFPDLLKRVVFLDGRCNLDGCDEVGLKQTGVLIGGFVASVVPRFWIVALARRYFRFRPILSPFPSRCLGGWNGWFAVLRCALVMFG